MQFPVRIIVVRHPKVAPGWKRAAPANEFYVAAILNIWETDRSEARGKVDIMDRQKLEHYRKLLERRRLNLRENVARTEKDGRAAQATDSAQDTADRASSSYQKEFLFTRSNNDRQFLQMVEHALSNISEGSYGDCEQCGNAINERRLEAVPWARHCIGCQEKLERGELEQQAS